MIDLKSGLKSAADKQRWAERGASFVAKVKATKAVWFPPEPTKTGKRATSAAKKATKKATRKPARKATAAAGKSTAGAKRVTKRTPRKKA